MSVSAVIQRGPRRRRVVGAVPHQLGRAVARGPLQHRPIKRGGWMRATSALPSRISGRAAQFSRGGM